MAETEKQIETYLRKRVMEYRGLCLKFVSPGMVGVPDRICILPPNIICFIEVKGPQGKISGKQKRMIHKLQTLGQDVFIVRSKLQVDEFILYYLRSKRNADIR